MIILNNINKTYENKDIKVEALKNINLKIDKGLNAILGKSGSGKSTLMNLIGALDKPTSGEIYFDDKKITDLKDNYLAVFRNKNVGYIFQFFYLEPHLKVIDNICLPLTINGIAKADREEKALKYLEMLGLNSKGNQMTGKLSGGEMQRVCIARALINDPLCILADEPTGNLDNENAIAVMDLLKSISNEGKIVILVTHNEDFAKKYADRIIRIENGQIVGDEMNENN